MKNKRIPTPYEDLLEKVLNEGAHKSDRTGTGTRSIFGAQLRYDLSDSFPLITTKKVFTKGVIAELLWFLKGDTSVKYLLDQGVHIWDEWADPNGHLGNVYGAQWRSWLTPTPHPTKVPRYTADSVNMRPRAPIAFAPASTADIVGSSGDSALSPELLPIKVEGGTVPRSVAILWNQINAADGMPAGYTHGWGNVLDFYNDIKHAKGFNYWYQEAETAAPLMLHFPNLVNLFSGTKFVLAPEYFGTTHLCAETAIFIPKHGLDTILRGAQRDDAEVDVATILNNTLPSGETEIIRDKFYIDQITEIVDTLRDNPDSRRIILNAWNVGEIEDMALPPCHAFFQLYVENGKLSGQLYQRSADLFLGVPFNIASYSLLIHMLARHTGLKVGEFIWTGGDCHIYENHIEQVKEQLSREPREYPQVEFTCDSSTKLEDYTLEDFSFIGYNPHPTITAPVAV